ncbi:hypothetical protein ACEPAF_843 [Sanghuangporus sanghuang]
MSLCKECVTGVTHEGEPTGKIEGINGVQTYVAFPPTGKEYDKTKAILYLTDVFGIQLANNRLLVDDFAKNGFQTYAPDLLNGDPIVTMDGSFDRETWSSRHGPEQTRPTLDKAIAGLKERGVNEFAAVGYCFGARYVFDLAFDKEIKVAAVAHPSRLKVPEDLERIKTTGIPLLINSCEVDKQYPIESQKIGDDILGGGKMEAGAYKRAYFAGCVHGFAVRGDLSNPQIKAGKEQAFANTVEWFWKFL